jgi:uncharacterized membrane protein YfcA
MTILLYCLIGAIAGLLAGLLGIGGGLVVVPSLYAILTFIPLEYRLKIAIGTSLGAMIFTAGASFISHSYRKGVNWTYFRLLLPGVIIGAIIGAFIAFVLPGRWLELVFGVGFCLIGLYFLFPDSQKTPFIHPYHLLAGLVIGTLSSILGIGGGILTVPYLTWIRTPLREAIGTSAALGLPIALVGAFSFFVLGQESGGTGYLYLPALGFIALTSTILAPFGAYLAYLLPTSILKRLFGIFLCAVGLYMLIR